MFRTRLKYIALFTVGIKPAVVHVYRNKRLTESGTDVPLSLVRNTSLYAPTPTDPPPSTYWGPPTHFSEDVVDLTGDRPC